MIKRNIVIAVSCACLMSAFADAASAKSTSAQGFVQKASVSNEFEIQSSQLALEKSHNQNVRQFAQQMIDDHTNAGDKLEEALDNSDSGAQPADDLDGKHEALVNKLRRASGRNFDAQYVSMQLQAHKEAVSLFSTYARSGRDRALKDFAAQTLPTLKMHLQHVNHMTR